MSKRGKKRRPAAVAEIREALDFPAVGFDQFGGAMVKGGAPRREEEFDEENPEPMPEPR